MDLTHATYLRAPRANPIVGGTVAFSAILRTESVVAVNASPSLFTSQMLVLSTVRSDAFGFFGAFPGFSPENRIANRIYEIMPCQVSVKTTSKAEMINSYPREAQLRLTEPADTLPPYWRGPFMPSMAASIGLSEPSNFGSTS
jgi:hypothetical protein